MRHWILLGITFFSACPLQVRGDWPAFLGGSQRHVPSADIPLEWNETSGVAWKTPLPGHGQSSPVVQDDRVYLTAVEGPLKEKNWVLSFNLQSGQPGWAYPIESSMQIKNDSYTSRAAPTPVADGQGVYAFFESGDLVAVSPLGKLLWERRLVHDYGRYQGQFGLGASLAQLEDRLFVLADNEGPSYLLAVDKENGKTLWKTDRSSRTSWSSPMILEVHGQPQIVVSSAGTVDGYDPQNGELLWTISDLGGNTVASPFPYGDGRFLIGASADGNGQESVGASRSNLAAQIVKNGEEFVPKILWRNAKATCSFGTPIVHQGRAYYVNRSGVLYCIDVESGETLYNARLEESTWATPLGVADRIYFFGKAGTTTVIRSGDDFRQLAVNRLWRESADGGGPGGFQAEIQYGVALTDSGLLIRTGSNLYSIRALR